MQCFYRTPKVQNIITELKTIRKISFPHLLLNLFITIMHFSLWLRVCAAHLAHPEYTPLLEAEVCIEKYTMFRMDRQNRSHGGAANYVQDDLTASTELLDSFSNGTTELMTLYIKQLDLLITTVYRPPNTTLDHKNIRNGETARGQLNDLHETAPCPPPLE